MYRERPPKFVELTHRRGRRRAQVHGGRGGRSERGNYLQYLFSFLKFFHLLSGSALIGLFEDVYNKWAIFNLIICFTLNKMFLGPLSK